EAAHDCHTAAETPCTDDGDVCTDDQCDGLGACTHPNNTAPCDDLNPCTTDDVCSNGACGGTPILCDNGQFCDGEEACVGGMCHTVVAAPSCDDGIVCTTNTCDPMANDGHGACVNDPIPGCCSTDAECSDHDLCTGVETCNVRTGMCGHGTPVDCNDNNVCTLDSCDPMTGMCHFAPQPGCCNTDADCDDGIACTEDTCDTGTHACSHTDTCDDGVFCNGVETCNTNTGMCGHGTPVNCDDSSPCTTDFCDQGIGCRHTPVPDCCVADGDCDDMSICTGFETCVSNKCQPGMTLDCDDHNPCTDDSCNAQSGCQHANNMAPCDDGNACTTNDTC